MSEHEQDFPLVLGDVMEVLGSEYGGMIIGGVAVIALGHARATIDIDATLRIPAQRLAELVERFVLCKVPLSFQPLDNTISVQMHSRHLEASLDEAVMQLGREAFWMELHHSCKLHTWLLNLFRYSVDRNRFTAPLGAQVMGG